MDKIVYLFSDAENNPLYVGYGSRRRPIHWFYPGRCRAGHSRFGVWMLKNDFAATWRPIRTGLSIADAREIEGLVIQGIGTIDDGGTLLNSHRGQGAMTRCYLESARATRREVQAGFTEHQRASIPKQYR